MEQQNQDSVKDLLLDAADMANEAIGKAVDAIKEGARQVADKVKEYDALSPEEKKTKQEEWKAKAYEVAEQASDAVVDLADDIKEGAEKLFGNKED